MNPAEITHRSCPRCGGKLEFTHTVEATEPEHPSCLQIARCAQAAVDGCLPRGVGIANLRDASAEWSRQYARLGLAFPH